MAGVGGRVVGSGSYNDLRGPFFKQMGPNIGSRPVQHFLFPHWPMFDPMSGIAALRHQAHFKFYPQMASIDIIGFPWPKNCLY